MNRGTILHNYFGNFSVCTEREFSLLKLRWNQEMETLDRFINDLDGGTNSPSINSLMKLDGEMSGRPCDGENS